MNPVISIWDWLTGLDARIWQAVVAGGFVALGWVYNGRRNRREAANLRAERLRDVHRALYAEIGANLSNLAEEDALVAEAEAVEAHMAADPTYIPFLPREERNTVYRSVVSDIHVLPRTSIDPIVAYYAQLTSIANLVDDIRGETFAGLPKDRQIAIYRDLIGLKQQAVAFGNHALRMIKTYSDEGPEAAKALENQLKTRASSLQAVDRSGQ